MSQGKRAMPVLPVKDVQQAIDFYTEGLGFVLAGMWKAQDETATFGIVRQDSITVGLNKSDRVGSAEKWAAYFYVSDVEAFTDYVQSKGVRVLRGPETSLYNCREVELDDPDGNRLCFAEDLNPGKDGPGL
jgi:catechol 2,3-dioxygenase-like lactoylglutathione lyase family enzyme